MLKTFTNLPTLTFFLSSMRNRWRQDSNLDTSRSKVYVARVPTFRVQKIPHWGNPAGIQSQFENILYVHSSAR